MKETVEHNNRFYGEELKTESEQLKEWLMVANKENERLNKENKILRENAEHNDKVVDKVNWENKRLSNITNELEKWLVEWREMLDCPDFYEEGIIDCINDTLTKLQELKGSDKSE